jgi:hypothetical protein
MSPGATKLLDLPRGCCVWPHGDPALDTFRWCSAPAMPGKSYCERHAARAYDSGTADTDQPEIVEDTDTGRRYRIELRRGHNIGSHRQWRVVPIAPGGTARRSPVASTAAWAVTAPADADAHQRAAHGLAKPVGPDAPS